MAACRSCKCKTLLTDEATGETFCSSCGIVQEFDNYQHNFGGISGPQGTFVRLGTSGTGTDYSYKERKTFEANRIIEDITFRLNFTDARTREVKSMIDKVTDGELGLGNWFSVLVGACCYVIMRQNYKPMSINEVVGVVGCELYEMGKMVNRVVEFLGLNLPEFDVVGMLERNIRGFSGFSLVDKEKVELMVKQGIFVIQCAIKWFLTTGRRPGPVAVAVLVFVAAVNEIKVQIEDVAKEMNVAIATCRLRYKELLEAFVEVARGLPWGKDVNVKNIVKNAPFVMRYMEMKSMEDVGMKRRRFDDNDDDDDDGGFIVDNAVGECLSREVVYGVDDDGINVENGSRYIRQAHDQEGGLALTSNELNKLKVSHEDLAKIYLKFKNNILNLKLLSGNALDHYRDKLLSGQDLRLFDEWWSGRSELCRKLLLQQILEKDVGLDALPPSYVRGCLAVKRRREKIEMAKRRINNIVCPPNDKSNDGVLCSSLETQSDSRDGDVHGTSTYVNSRKKRRKQYDNIDWEDFIIETLLLHQVKEEEIEKGHYRALLGVHVFRSGVL